MDWFFNILDASDKLDDRVKLFFAGAKKQKTPDRDTEYEAIKGEYYKVLDDAGNVVYNLLSIVLFNFRV